MVNPGNTTFVGSPQPVIDGTNVYAITYKHLPGNPNYWQVWFGGDLPGMPFADPRGAIWTNTTTQTPPIAGWNQQNTTEGWFRCFGTQEIGSFAAEVQDMSLELTGLVQFPLIAFFTIATTAGTEMLGYALGNGVTFTQFGPVTFRLANGGQVVSAGRPSLRYNDQQHCYECWFDGRATSNGAVIQGCFVARAFGPRSLIPPVFTACDLAFAWSGLDARDVDVCTVDGQDWIGFRVNPSQYPQLGIKAPAWSLFLGSKPAWSMAQFAARFPQPLFVGDAPWTMSQENPPVPIVHNIGWAVDKDGRLIGFGYGGGGPTQSNPNRAKIGFAIPAGAPPPPPPPPSQYATITVTQPMPPGTYRIVT